MKLFGTDGVRGIPGRPPLTMENVRRLGRSAAEVFLKRGRVRTGGPGVPLVLMGRDTRASGPALGKALTDGFARVGCRVLDMGVAPTPAVSYLTPRMGGLCGVVLSASHNPPEFNGIKFLAGTGRKVPAEVEAQIESRLGTPLGRKGRPAVSRGPELVREYVDFLRSTFPAHHDLAGVRLVVDAAHGAAHAIAPGVFRELGATVFELGCRPDGRNINKGCGALETGRMRREVLRRKADCGISLDGDADRAILADERGRPLDGDALIAMLALSLQDNGLLPGSKVVVTVMSNLGLLHFLQGRGIGAVQVPVGDRNVSDALVAGGYNLGGENSGHIIFRHLAPTGDGMLTALQVLAAWRSRGGLLSRHGSLYAKFPQVLRNVRVARRVPVEELRGFQRAVRRALRALKDSGRVFVRYSGTEPLLRILVEGRSRSLTEKLASDLVRSFKKETEGVCHGH